MDIETARKFLDAAIEARKRKVARLIKEGKSLSEIARVVGVSRQRVQMIAREIRRS